MDDFTPNRTDPRLARALRARLSAPSSSCPDAERLAAWSDGGLKAVDAAEVEVHLADCGRCQAVVSALSTAKELEPTAAVAQPASASAAVIPFGRRPVMKWALPLAASLAASLVIWNVLREQMPGPADVPAESTQTMAAPAAAPPAPLVQPAPQPLRPSAPTANQAAERRTERDMARTSADQLAERNAAARGFGGKTAAATPPPPPPAMALPAPSPKPGAADARASTVTGLPQTTLNVTIDGVSARPPARQDVAGGIALEAKPLAQFASASPLFRATADSAAVVSGQATGTAAGGQTGAGRAGGGRGGGGGRAGRGAVSAPAALEVAQKQETADPLTHWRILAGNRVERSRDNGLTWTAMALDAELPGITNGAAPSGRICWLVGARGLVLVSADATTFTRVSAPSEADLVSIRASDAVNAVVTTADGRTFTTADGGKTWTQLTPNT